MKYKLSNIKYQLSLSILLAVVLFASPVKAQVMVGNSTSPNSFSQLEIDTTYQKGGLRLPQLTTVGRNNLNITASDQAANGLVIYNVDTQCIEFWNDGVWVSLCNGSPKIILDDLSRGANIELDVADPFPANASTLPLIPHDTPECTGTTNPYTSAILLGGSYAHVVPTGSYSSDGTFNLTMDANPSADARMAILRVTDNCTKDYRDFLLVQLGCSVPAIPDEITGQKFASTEGVGVTYQIDPVTNATSYTWTLPKGWIGSSNSNTLFAKPGAQAEDGTISVTANSDCGSSDARTMDVKVVHGCGAMIDADTWKEFMCWNLGADPTADPFTPSPALNGDYYQWGYKYPSATYDTTNGNVILGTPVDAFGNPYPDPTLWFTYIYDPTVYGTDVYSATPGVYGTGVIGDQTSTVKSATDPCPAGYRIPSSKEWTGVSTYNKVTPTSTSLAEPNIIKGIFLGDALFLPVTGSRSPENGFLVTPTFYGYYWSSSLASSNNAYFLFFHTFDNPTPDLSVSRPTMDGFIVRCIKQ